jgi:DNA mismatch endonuclease (patch repair protein)
MSRVRGKDTKPELMVRRILHGLGYRYRLHAKELPGKPDIVLRRRRKAIFVHGCFWHRHLNCALARIPKSRHSFWIPKLEGNRQRDLANEAELTANGWKCLTVWECELRDKDAIAFRLEHFFSEDGARREC